jgi:hypothetical protein
MTTLILTAAVLTHDASMNLTQDRIDMVKTGLAAGAGTGAPGSDKAPVRLAGLYARERLAARIAWKACDRADRPHADSTDRAT